MLGFCWFYKFGLQNWYGWTQCLGASNISSMILRLTWMLPMVMMKSICGFVGLRVADNGNYVAPEKGWNWY